MSQENVEIAKQAFAAIARGDLQGLLALIDPEVEFNSLVAEAEGRVYRGHDGVREWWKTVAKALGGLRWETPEIRDLGDGVLVKMVVTATVSEVEVPQTMWQAIEGRDDGKVTWWHVARTEEEALAAFRARHDG